MQCLQLYTATDSARYTKQIENYLSDFNKQFKDFNLLKPDTKLMSKSFRVTLSAGRVATECADCASAYN